MVFCAQRKGQFDFMPVVKFSVCKVNPQFVLKCLLSEYQLFFLIAVTQALPH